MLSLSSEDFAGTKLRHAGRILALFYANWCPFCKNSLTLFEATMRSRADPIGALVDISDTENRLWETFDVKIVPTLVGFKDGEPTVRKNGIPGRGLDSTELENAVSELQRL
jgi:thiol-disulfide isomerase/thioredoxin